ncbi:hypothetical protein KCU87_g256, partial [Aureobasidium melanogenum]
MAALKYWSLNSEDVVSSRQGCPINHNDSRNKRNFQALMSQHGPLYYSTTIACAHGLDSSMLKSPIKSGQSRVVKTTCPTSSSALASPILTLTSLKRRALSIAPSDSPPGGALHRWLKAVPAGPSRRSIHDQTRRKENQR